MQGNLKSTGTPRILILEKTAREAQIHDFGAHPLSLGKNQEEGKEGFPVKALLRQLQAIAVSVKEVLFSQEPGKRQEWGGGRDWVARQQLSHFRRKPQTISFRLCECLFFGKGSV